MKITRRQLRRLIESQLYEALPGGGIAKEKCTNAHKFASIDTSRDRIIINDTVKFVTGKAKLKPESYDLLDAVVCLMTHSAQLQRKSVRVEGHTDSVGGDDMNMRLSQARAKSVADYLIRAGLAKDRVTSVGIGETKPIDSNDTDAGRAKNRRVEFHLVNVIPGHDFLGDIRRIKANMPKLPKPSAPMTSQHPDFPPELRAKNEGKRLTHTQLRQIIKEELNEVTLPRSLGPRPGGSKSPLGNLAEDILDTIVNAVGQVDLDFSDAPMTRKDIIEFVLKMLIEEEPSAMIAGKVDPSWARRKYAPEPGDPGPYARHLDEPEDSGEV